MIDPFGRRITYLRVSVTDRCDFRCVYCMAETMDFLPRKDLLSLEEIDRLASAFIASGVRKARLTGGEPLVRKNMHVAGRAAVAAFRRGPRRADPDHQWQPACHHAEALAACGMARINVSLDTLDPAKFRAITRRGDLSQVHGRHRRRDRAGIKIKINTVALRDVNEDEIEDLIRWAHGRGFDLTLIETMPMGEIGTDRTEQYLPLSLRARAAFRSTSRSTTFPTARAARRAMCMCARPAAGSASSRRSRIISARPATACG